MTSPLSASYSKQKSWRPGGSSSELPLLLLSPDSSQSGLTRWAEASVRANQNEREKGVLLKSLPTKSSEKENQESLQAADSLWVFVHVNSVCVWGAVNQDFNFPFYFYPSTALLQSRYKMHTSPANITGSCGKDGQNSAWVQIQTVIYQL